MGTLRTMLSPDDFWSDTNRSIYQALCDMYDAGHPIDLVTLCQHMIARDSGGMWGTEVARASDAAGVACNLEAYAHAVKQTANARHAQKIARRWALEAGENPTANIAAGMIADLQQLRTGRIISLGPTAFRDEHDAWLAAGGDQACLTTGIRQLDHYVKCMDDFLWVIGARPKTGKTSFVVDLFARFATTGQGTGLFYSLEMSASRILRKFHARIVPHQDYLRRVGESQYRPVTIGDVMAEHSDALYSLPLRIVDNEHSIEGIVANARHEVHQNPDIRYIAIDYVEMITTSLKGQGTVETINHALRSLVALKKELRVPIFLVSQLRRKGDDFGAEPSMDELKGSGLIEQSADVMVLLWEGARSQAEALICGDVYKKVSAKIIQRDGPHGVIQLQAYMPQSRFRDWPTGGTHHEKSEPGGGEGNTSPVEAAGAGGSGTIPAQSEADSPVDSEHEDLY